MSAMLEDRRAVEISADELESTPSAAPLSGTFVGALIGFRAEGRTPLVLFREQHGSAAVAARSTVDLHGAHIGRQVLLVCERGDVTRPIIVGWLRGDDVPSLDDQPGSVEVDADGQRLIVAANDQLVLRCGKASITLTKAGKVLIEGTYLSSRSSGVNRVKGGSVQLN
jgi:hypothetical protein